MKEDTYIKTALIEYVKTQNKYSGKILDAINHIDEAINTLQELPLNIQEEIKQIIVKALILQGVIK